jgi:hypothetical protein
LGNSPTTITCSAAPFPPYYIGYVDHTGCDNIRGWAADRNRPDTAINVQIYDGTTLMAVVPANQPRPDVRVSRSDNGMHGFSITTPAALKTGTAHSIHVNFETSGIELGNSPTSISCTAATN